MGDACVLCDHDGTQACFVDYGVVSPTTPPYQKFFELRNFWQGHADAHAARCDQTGPLEANMKKKSVLYEAGLTDREIQVICHNFAIPLPEGVEPLNPKAGRERVRQIEAKALRKLRPYLPQALKKK